MPNCTPNYVRVLIQTVKLPVNFHALARTDRYQLQPIAKGSVEGKSNLLMVREVLYRLPDALREKKSA